MNGTVFYCGGGIAAARRLQRASGCEEAWISATELGWWLGWLIAHLRRNALDEFERRYAERSGVTVDWLHQNGRFGAPCDCGDEICEGFQMLPRDRDV